MATFRYTTGLKFNFLLTNNVLVLNNQHSLISIQYLLIQPIALRMESHKKVFHF